MRSIISMPLRFTPSPSSLATSRMQATSRSEKSLRPPSVRAGLTSPTASYLRIRYASTPVSDTATDITYLPDSSVHSSRPLPGRSSTSAIPVLTPAFALRLCLCRSDCRESHNPCQIFARLLYGFVHDDSAYFCGRTAAQSPKYRTLESASALLRSNVVCVDTRMESVKSPVHPSGTIRATRPSDVRRTQRRERSSSERDGTPGRQSSLSRPG